MRVKFYPVKIHEKDKNWGYGPAFSRRMLQHDENGRYVCFSESVDAEDWAIDHDCDAITCEVVEWKNGGYYHTACPVFRGAWNGKTGDWAYSAIKYVR